MKRMLCVIAGTCGLFGWASADEIGMKNVLSVWNSRQADWESAFKIAETDEKRAELLKSQPDAVTAARDLWGQVGRDPSKPYTLPAIVWFLDHPQALEEAFPGGNVARKILLNCLNALENNMVMEKGAGQAAHALSNSRDLRCRTILEKIKDLNQFPEDQGLASLGLAMVMKESSGMQQDDGRLVAARGKLLKDAIIKCYDSKFGPIPVKDLVKEELYEIRNLNIGQTGPKIKLPSSATGTWVEIPSGDKPVLLVFWDPRDAMSVKFLEKAASLRKEFPGMTVMPVAPVSEEGVKKALLNLSLDIPSLVDAQAVAFKDYRVAHTPRVYLLDPKGKILMRGTPDLLFDANLYAAMNKFKGKEAEKAPQAPSAAPSVLIPERVNSPDTRVPAGRPAPASRQPVRPAAPVAPPVSAPPLRPIPE